MKSCGGADECLETHSNYERHPCYFTQSLQVTDGKKQHQAVSNNPQYACSPRIAAICSSF